MSENRASAILEVGQQLIQTRGYAGFSYRDIAAAVGIKSASVHYHFPTKADLAMRVTRLYRDEFVGHLKLISQQGGSCRAQLKRYAGLYGSALTSGRLCLCGMLATESALLPDALRAEVDAFFGDQTSWLQQVLTRGVEHGELAEDTDVPMMASVLVSALEGAMIIARNRGSKNDLGYVVDALLPQSSANVDGAGDR